MIRKMFEAGVELKKKYGADKVYDFSLGNPDLPPPAEVKEALHQIADKADQPFALGYMPNGGYPDVREIVAAKVSEEQGVKISANELIMSCGAAGGLNALFRAILTPGSEVICPSPYFVEYGFYTGNFGGKLVPVKSKDFTFELDIPAIAAAVNENTKAVIINSPNNPTGQIYSAGEIKELCDALHAAEEKFGTKICLIADEPYRFLNFDGVEIPSVFSYYANSVVIGSYSKNLSLAGERMGYIAVNPQMYDLENFMAAITMTTRILGTVNAPCIGQQLLRSCINAQVDLEVYRQRRELMAQVLTDAGLEFTLPRGAFYFFVKSPVEDEREFVKDLADACILTVPGRGFGCPGYIRLTFCVGEKVIRASAESFRKVMEKYR
jgi:aspartate aminotransferase